MKKDFIVRRSITMIDGKPHVETYSEQELIRCKDCKKCDLPEEKPYENGYCSRCGYVTMDWFCADGERKDSE